ncbi:PKD domain containing protein [Halorhabdus utahensis DSM 12940]|uniref:PKD domain containing protein n=1 Tax=Halorhabdus utahensis (strain DSM 12940 / JCM 11049 / AX-2) TaxID=519442 RepID=C7NQ74_HALUD|nr:PKD domain containing protein [Halorhabdus utahensis DSM 12940]
MRTAGLVAVVLLGLCAGGALVDGAVASDTSTTTDGTFDQGIALNETIESELDAGDRFDEEMAGHHENYTFYAESGDVISAEMRPDGSNGHATDAHAAQLRLYAPNGTEVFGSYNDVQGSAQLESVSLDATGQYTLIATTNDIGAVGSYSDDVYDDETAARTDTFEYQLRLYEGLGPDRALNIGENITDSVSEADNYLDDQAGYYDAYTFEGQTGQTISAELRPNGSSGHATAAHAAQLRLYAPNGTEVFGSYNDVQGSAQLESVSLDATGQYTLIATTNDIGAVGSYSDDVYDDETAARTDTFEYQLRLYEGLGPDRALNIGENITDSVSEADNYLDDQAGYYDAYTFEGERGKTLNFEMRVNQPTTKAAQLRLYAPNGTEVFGSYNDVQGSAQLESVSLDATGQYTLIATTNDIGAVGSYSDDVYDDETAARTDTFRYQLRAYELGADAPVLTTGTSLTGALSVRDNYLDKTDGFFDLYHVSATSSSELTATVIVDNPTDHAARVAVYDNDGSIVDRSYNNDGGGVTLDFSPDTTGGYYLAVTTEPDASTYGSTRKGLRDTFRYQLTIDGPENSPPIVTAKAPHLVANEQTVRLNATALDPNGDALSYQWSQVMGAFPDPEVTIENADEAVAMFTAPDVPAATELTFDVAVTDDSGATTHDTVNVTVDPNYSPPSVDFTYTPSNPTADETVSFSESASDPDGSIQSYDWQFGDGNSSSSTNPTHTYSSAGSYNVSLTVADGDGNTNSTTKPLSVEADQSFLTIEQAIDKNSDGQIGDFEVLTAVEYWRAGETVPNTNGKKISDSKIAALLEHWRTGTEV